MAYIEYTAGGAIVRCKGCQRVLVDAKQPTAAYCGMIVAMREPNHVLSKHETPMCKPCRARFRAGDIQPGELEKLYAEDIEQWIESALRAGYTAEETYRLAERQALRTPLRVLDEPGSVGD